MRERWLATSDVADVLGISEATVKRWADAGTLGCDRTRGGHRKFRFKDVVDYLATRAGAPLSDRPPPANQQQVDELVGAMFGGDVDRVGQLLDAARPSYKSCASIVDVLLMPCLAQIRAARLAHKCEPFHEQIAECVLLKAADSRRALMPPTSAPRGRIVLSPGPDIANELFTHFAGFVAADMGLEPFVLRAGLEPGAIVRSAVQLGASWLVLPLDPIAPLSPASDVAIHFVEAAVDRAANTGVRVVCVAQSVIRKVSSAENVVQVPNLRGLQQVLSPIGTNPAQSN